MEGAALVLGLALLALPFVAFGVSLFRRRGK